MSISVLVAIVGVMVAAVHTGLVGGRCIRSPSPSFIAWTIGMIALTVALLAQSIGFATDFDPVTFRVIQLAAQLVAPVVLAWGLVELVARGPAARLGARLAAAALIVVIGVILATDPLAAGPFSTAWPAAAGHYQLIPHFALIALHLTVAVVTVTAVALCAARGRGQSARDQLLPGAAAAGAAVLFAVALRFTLPAPAYPALSVLSAGLAWFAVTRLDGRVPGVSRGGTGGTRARDVPGRPRAGSHAGRAHGAGAAGRYGTADAEPDFPPGRLSRSGFSADGPGRPGFPGEGPGSPGRGPGRSRFPAGGSDRAGFPAAEPVRPGSSAADFTGAGPPGTQRRAGVRPAYTPGVPGAEPVTGAIEPPGTALSRQPVPGEPRPGGPGTDIVRPAPRPHGLIAIFTLLEDKVAAFDRIAEEAAEQVRAQEPDTLVYVIHTVPKAPMQRIFYEIYRDRAAYERHEQQSYIKRFVAARRPYVLATNVIELRLKYAKISPLVQDGTQVPFPAGASSAGALPRSAGPAPVSQALPPGYGGAPSADYGGWRSDGTGGWDDGQRGDGARHWGGRRLGDGARDWGDRWRGDGPADARVAGGRRGRGHLPPPVPPRGYEAI